MIPSRDRLTAPLHHETMPIRFPSRFMLFFPNREPDNSAGAAPLSGRQNPLPSPVRSSRSAAGADTASAGAGGGAASALQPPPPPLPLAATLSPTAGGEASKDLGAMVRTMDVPFLSMLSGMRIYMCVYV